jgi:basic membrane protein A
MKKLLLLVSAFAVMVSLTACQKETFKIALVTDVGTVTDKSFNQGAWEGVVEFAEEFDYTHQYYQPDDQTTDEYVKSIDLAVENGAEVIVTPGFFFENAVYLSQDTHPEVKFIILDGSPHNVANWDTGDTVDGEEWDFRQEKNVVSIFYAEHESGFLAGYAAVKDGMTELGFMGGKAVPAVVRFGYGFVQGAEKAAMEMDVEVNVKYNYLGGFGPDTTFQQKAATWYSEGTEVIFAAAGGAGGSVMKAAEQEDGKVIGVDVDQSGESDTVITSAKKELAPSVYETLKDWHEGNFPEGETLVFDAANLGVALPDDFSGFTTFAKTDYETLLGKVQDGTYDVMDDLKKADDTDKTTAELLAAYLADAADKATKVTVTVID